MRLSPTTLEFAAGKVTALQGQSGSGKSTILQILLGFGQFTGKIQLLDGDTVYDHQALNQTALRQQMGYLAQSVSLLPMSIADNLRLAKKDATEDELQAVLEMVGLWTLISQLPNGINTVLSERGGGISGGQAQRIGIAQLLLQDAKIWLLDEPTEHLDGETAQAVAELLHRLAKDKTVIWVTHDVALGERFDACHQL